MNEVQRYYVGKYGLVEGEALGRLSVVLAADFDNANLLFLDAAERCIASERREKELQALLTAADERADALETALRKIKGRLDAYAESDMRMPEPSVEVCQAIADAALKPAEGGGDPCEFCKGWGFRSNPDGADEGCGPCSGTGKEPSDDQP